MTFPKSDKSVGKWVTEHPARSIVFEKYGIDYCCGGKRSLEEAAEKAGVPLGTLIEQLEIVTSTAPESETDWSTSTLTELADHIEKTHHAYLRELLPRVEAMSQKVAHVHGAKHPELKQLFQVFSELKQELTDHMWKEEQILFPICRLLDTDPSAANQHCGVEGPVQQMEHEHDQAGNALAEMRWLTKDYELPEDACNTYRVLFDALQEFEKDLHLHIHKENNILFPRAIEIAGVQRQQA